MIGNSIFVIIFYSLKKYKKFGQIAGIVMGGFLKFLFLFLSASKLITLFKLGINPKLANTLIASMGIVQFITAVIGGIVALLLLNILKKRRQI